MTFDEFNQVVAEAESVEQRANEVVQQLARICVGRLRSSHASVYVLARLKRELRDFDLRDYSWRDK